MANGTLKTIVQFRDGSTVRASCTLRKAEKAEDLWMDPELFYKKHAGAVPEFPHYELELKGSYQCEHVHYHESERDPTKQFCCWTSRIANPEDAREMFRVWSMGTAYTLMTGKDFVPRFQEVGGKISAFFELMEKEFGAVLEFEE